ncbi:hypothetical protein [Bdellovibrio bacteriovorus]|uniref:hypothetical protein n=1 Tax=Bdellovibrio bacteriovorus TaxID=959 RepID=UPI003D0870A7
MKLVLTAITSAALLLTSCQQSSKGGTSTGNPLVSFKLTASSAPATLTAQSSRFRLPWLEFLLKPAMALPPPALQDSGGLVVTLSHAWIAVKEVEFKATEVAGQDEVDGDEISFEGPFVVDLLTSQPESFGQARIGTSTLRRIKMQLHNTDTLPAAAPAQMLNKSIYWNGTVNGHAFSISSREGYEYELGGSNGVSLSENSSILMSIQIANLFKKIDLSGISSDTVIDEQNRFAAVNPCPLIDASASDIYTCFTKGLESESNVGRDDDGDDDLGDSDDTVK